MAEAEKSLGSVRFGPFELSLETQELRKHGVPVNLSGQAIQILIALTGSPGKLITREELQQRLWPGASYGDPEHGLNAAVNKLREKLGDSATTPVYVETLPGRGYWFIGSIDSGEHEPAPEPPKPRRKLTAAIAGTVIALVVGAAVLTYFWARPEPVPKVSNYTQLTHDRQLKRLVGTDGSRLYLGLGFYGGQGVAQMPISGGEPTTIPVSSPNVYPSDLSPDGSRLLVNGMGAGRALWSLPVLGGSPRRLGDAEGQDGAWSADGKMLAYCRGSELFVAKADGTESRKLITIKEARRISRPVWSSDGTHLRFDSSSPSQPSSIWEVSIDGTDVHQLLTGWHHPPEECCGKWTADGSYFVFESDHQIWALPQKRRFFRSEQKPVQLTSGPLWFSTAVPSKDGKKLFVVGETRRGEMMRYDVKSGQFVPFLGGISAEFVAFSKDGQWVAYVSYPEGTLWRSKADGSQRLQLTFEPGDVAMPRWSPDGKQIEFMTMPPDKPGRIFEISAEGGTPRPLMPDEPSPQGDPYWSPDGNKLVFGGAAFDTVSAIRVFDLTTHQVSTLPGSQGFHSPRWSPNRRYIVAFSADSRSLLLFDFQTQKWTELAKGWFDHPNWSKDGEYVYVLDASGPPAVLRIRLSDRNTERAVDLKDFVSTGRFAWSLALAPDDSPLLLRDAGTQDVYALDWKEP